MAVSATPKEMTTTEDLETRPLLNNAPSPAQQRPTPANVADDEIPALFADGSTSFTTFQLEASLSTRNATIQGSYVVHQRHLEKIQKYAKTYAELVDCPGQGGGSKWTDFSSKVEEERKKQIAQKESYIDKLPSYADYKSNRIKRNKDNPGKVIRNGFEIVSVQGALPWTKDWIRENGPNATRENFIKDAVAKTTFNESFLEHFLPGYKAPPKKKPPQSNAKPAAKNTAGKKKAPQGQVDANPSQPKKSKMDKQVNVSIEKVAGAETTPSVPPALASTADGQAANSLLIAQRSQVSQHITNHQTEYSQHSVDDRDELLQRLQAAEEQIVVAQEQIQFLYNLLLSSCIFPDGLPPLPTLATLTTMVHRQATEEDLGLGGNSSTSSPD